MDRKRATNWLTAAAIAIAAAVPLGQAVDPHGGFGVTLGLGGLLYWPAVVVWGVCVVCVLRWRRRWWLLATAPLVLYPAVMLMLLGWECSRGNCL